MWQLIFSNIRQRPTRALVSVLAVSLGVVLLLVSVGLAYGQLVDQAERARRVGGDFLLQPSGASLFFALNSGTLSTRLVRVVEEVPGVEAATPVLVKFISEGFLSLFGVEKESFSRVNGGLSFVKGRMFQEPLEAVVDTIYAAAHQLDVGSHLELLGQQFQVTGIFRQGTAARILIPLATLQELNGTPEKCTLIFIRAQSGFPLAEVEANLRNRFTHYQLIPASELQDLLTSSAPAFGEFLTAILCITVAISFIITLLAMYSNIIERTREIGILKSLGASKSYIVLLILKESLVLCAFGVLLGFGLSSLALQGIQSVFPTLPVVIFPQWKVVAVAMAIGGGLLGALYPAWKAAQLDPVQALGYE